MNAPSDHGVRELALDPARSFIVEAPAGSGKTELLTRRYLRLLTCVRAPEDILAITFTRKAAAEMRNRVLKALSLAASDTPPEKDMERAIWPLARAVRAADAQHDWRLLQHPARLRIMTIDALNASLAKQLPILSGAGAPLAIARDSEALYADVVARIVERLGTRTEAADAVARLMRHLDNQYDAFEKLLSKELSRREYWLDLGLMRFEWPALRERLEAALQDVVTQELKWLDESVPPEERAELVALAAHAGGVLRNAGDTSAIAACANWTRLPLAESAALADWQSLAALLLTKDDALRAAVDKRVGFLPGDSEMKQRMLALLQRLANHSTFQQALALSRQLPKPRYTDAQWQVLIDLLRVLKLAVAELELAMRERGECDYVANAIAARRALGAVTEPTDLAMRLDYRLQHLLVDEFQDTSRGQVELLALLTAGWSDGDGRTLFCVGDPMQSIYRFRHADVGLFLNLKRHGLNQLKLTPLRLTVNFRSNKPIVSWVNRAFAHVLPRYDDPERGAVAFTPSEPKRDADEAGGVFVHAIVEADRTQARSMEARRIADLIIATQAREPNAKIAVLVGTRNHLRFLVRELHARGVAFQAVEIDPLADRPAIQDLVALTRALTHLADRTAWLAVLRAPWCGLTLQDLFALSAGESSGDADNEPSEPNGEKIGETIWEAMHRSHRLSALSADGRARVERVSAILERALSLRGRVSLRECVERTWHALGGPATVSGESVLQDAASYFDRLELIERNGDLEDSAQLEVALKDLYAAAATPSKVELMTIHRAKGLEFDVVILPALDAVARRDDPPLLRAQELPELGDQALLLAPIAARGVEPDAIYRWLGTLEKERARFEKGRLLYVAATRAERELHLFGAVKPDGKPQADTSLSELWPLLHNEFAAPPATAPSDAAEPLVSAVRTRRLPLAWPVPDPLPPLRTAMLRDVASATPLQPEFEWAGETSRHIGTLVHREIERIARQGIAQADLAAHAARYGIALLELGVPPALLESAIGRVREALDNMLSDERGRWLLQNDAHREAASEFALSGTVEGQIVNVVIDRTFVDADGVRWIVDFKTSTHEGGGLDEFLASEETRYRPQLTRYARLMREFRPDQPVKAALYFPLLKAWRTVEV